MVLDINMDLPIDSMCAQDHGRVVMGEFEGVLQQVGQRRMQQIPVGQDAQQGVNGPHLEGAVFQAGIEPGGLLDV